MEEVEEEEGQPGKGKEARGGGGALGGGAGAGPGCGLRRSGRRLRQARRARKRGRGGPRWAGAGRAAGAAGEAGAGLLSPGRPHCSALSLQFAVLRARPSRGRGPAAQFDPYPHLPELQRSGRVESAPQVLLSDSATEGFPTRDPVERRLYNVPLNWRKLGEPATHTLKEEGKQHRSVYKVITR